MANLRYSHIHSHRRNSDKVTLSDYFIEKKPP